MFHSKKSVSLVAEIMSSTKWLKFKENQESQKNDRPTFSIKWLQKWEKSDLIESENSGNAVVVLYLKGIETFLADMHPFRRTLPKGAIWGQTPMWHRNSNIKINQVRAWKRWWYCCLFLCHNHSSLFSLKMSTKITPNKLSDCLVLQKKVIYRLEGCPFSGWSIAALVRQHRGGFSFTCVQQSWTTLAGVSPVTVIASGSLGSDPLTIFLKKKDQK